MSMTIKILIAGLAICYKEDNYWNVIFLCDDIHPVRLTQSEAKIDDEALYIKGTNSEITFDFVSVPDPVVENFEDIFNMAAEYAHGPGNLLKRRTPKKNVIRMIIPDAKFNTHVFTDREYFVQYIGDGTPDGTLIGDPVNVIGRVAHVIAATVEVNSGIKMTIKDLGTGGEPTVRREVYLPQDNEKTLTFDFNNDCKSDCRGNDFLDLYEWVKHLDRAGKERRFVARQIRNGIVNGNRRVHRVEGDQDIFKEKSMVSSQQGNCDPVSIMPPATPEP